jgi:hypothetical protein
MQSEDAANGTEWDVGESKRSIDEWEEIASHLLELLESTADSAAAQTWAPHAAQITRVVSRFRSDRQRSGQS